MTTTKTTDYGNNDDNSDDNNDYDNSDDDENDDDNNDDDDNDVGTLLLRELFTPRNKHFISSLCAFMFCSYEW